MAGIPPLASIVPLVIVRVWLRAVITLLAVLVVVVSIATA